MAKYKFISDEDYEIAEKNGLSRQNVRNRVRQYGWSIEEAIHIPKMSKNRRRFGLHQDDRHEDFILTDEQMKTLESNGLTRYMVYARVRNYGWDLEKAISHPKIPRSERRFFKRENG